MIKTDMRKQRIPDSFLVPSATEPIPLDPSLERRRYQQASYIPVLRCRGVDSNEVTLTGEEVRVLARVLSEKSYTPREFEQLKAIFEKLKVPTFGFPEDFFGPFSPRFFPPSGFPRF